METHRILPSEGKGKGKGMGKGMGMGTREWNGVGKDGGRQTI